MSSLTYQDARHGNEIDSALGERWQGWVSSRTRVQRCVRACKGLRRVLTLFSNIRRPNGREEKMYVGRGGSAYAGDRAGEGERRAKCALRG